MFANDPTFRNLDQETASVIETFFSIDLHANKMKEKETIDMWEALETIKREAAAEAVSKAVLNEKRTIAQKLMDDLNVTEEQACQLVGIPCNEQSICNREN